MARQEMLMARCDRKECHTVVEIDRTTEAPEGWLEIRVEVEGKYDTRAKLEFCSEKCVSIWARNRGSSKSNFINPTNGSRAVKEEIIAAIKILDDDGKVNFTVSDIVGVTEIDKSTVNRHLKQLVENHEVEFRTGEGTKTDPRVYGVNHRISI